MARRDPFAGTVRLAVDGAGTGSTDPLATVVREGNGLFVADRQTVIDDIEELEKRHVRTDIMRGVIDKFTGLRWTGLPPDAQGDREKFLSRSGGDHGELQGLTCRSAWTS